MIQRKQSLFLLVVFILSLVGVTVQLGNIEASGMGVEYKVYSMCIVNADASHNYLTAPLFIVYTLNGILSLATIFLYNNRKMQMKFCNIGIVMEVLWYAVMAYLWTSKFGEYGTFHPSVSVCIPVICIILYAMSHAGVLKDEKLVRSMDRIR